MVIQMDKIETYSCETLVELQTVMFDISRLCECFTSAVQTIKLFNQVPIVSLILRFSRQFINNFMKHFPKLTLNFISLKVEITECLKISQRGTRVLQYTCNEYKTCRDDAIQRSIPPTRKALEMFLYGVKKMMADNDLQSVFFLGICVLINR